MTTFETDLVSNNTSMTRIIRAFWISSGVVLSTIGGWAVAAKVDSAIIAGGTFSVQSNAQAVQHPEGGVIGAILVKEGAPVQEGQVVVRLDAAKVLADLAILDRKLIDLIAERSRLDAERVDSRELAPAERLSPSPATSKVAIAAALQTALASQRQLMAERRSVRANQLSQLEERKRQSESLLAGLRQQVKASEEEMEQAAAELKDLRMLEAKGLIPRPRLRQSEREVSRLRGQIGEITARVMSAQSQLAEAEFKISETTQSSRSDVLSQIQANDAKLAQAREERLAAMDRMNRLEIRAPKSGLVNEMAIHTVGGVIGSGQTLMTIVPVSDPLIVTARIKPDEIDEVHVGQKATVRISSFKMATPPELDATVIGVSPDQVKDERSGQPYFSVKLSVEPGERDKLGGKALTPGLPAEVLMRGEARRVIAYLTAPVLDKIGLAFREK